MSVNISVFVFFLLSSVYFHYGQSTKIETQNLKPKTHYELHKALVGETVRLECPQPNPTWFYRRFSDSTSMNNLEDIIVTRHGIINSDYRYKIMCHMTLKHKVILINNIDFGEEGLYTCLYTLPSESTSNSNFLSEKLKNPIQIRYVFNVTVYTLISGLNMHYVPSQLITNSDQMKIKKYDHQPLELIENSLTVKEGDEFSIKCIIDSSKPAADIKFLIKNEIIGASKNEMMSLNNNHFLSYLTLPPTTQSPKLSSLIFEESNYSKNNDQTFKTIHMARLKAKREDNGKIFKCIAENGFSNQKWEVKKTLNILYAPVCKDPHNFVYYVGINQTINVECKILDANPSRVSYEWNLDNIKKQSRYKQGEHLELLHFNNFITKHNYLTTKPKKYLKKDVISFQNDDFNSKFKWMPTDSTQFGRISCKATNDVGTTECNYEIKLGGIPNPPTDCTYVLKNSSAIISCIVGFHQGDPDIYCYLLKKSENEVYKEHTRNRESCSFIVNDVNMNKLNEFWIYSSNKYGHNKDLGFHLSIGQEVKALEPESNKNMIMIGIIIGVFAFCIISCCFCFRIKKGLTEDNESISDHEPYKKANFHGIKGKHVNSTRSIREVKNFKDDKYLKIDLSDNYLDQSKNNELYVKSELDKIIDGKKKMLKFETQTRSNTKKNPQMIETSVKKSLSFLDELNHSMEDESKLIKDLSYPKSNVTSLEDKNSLNENNNNSCNKMVTFSHQKNLINKSLNSENQTNTTVSTSISGSSDSAESPNLYLSNDSDGVDSSSLVREKLTVSDQSSKQPNNFLQNKKYNLMNAFSDTNEKIFRTPKCFIETQDGLPSASSSLNQESIVMNSQDYSGKFTDSFEGKYLNKFCEDIEVSLNVDCADDYSVNDFSGDYSFDNGQKTQIYSTIPSKQFSTGQQFIHKFSEIRKNTEHKKTIFSQQNNLDYTLSKKNSIERLNNSNKNSHLGVLV